MNIKPKIFVNQQITRADYAYYRPSSDYIRASPCKGYTEMANIPVNATIEKINSSTYLVTDSRGVSLPISADRAIPLILGGTSGKQLLEKIVWVLVSTKFVPVLANTFVPNINIEDLIPGDLLALADQSVATAVYVGTVKCFYPTISRGVVNINNHTHLNRMMHCVYVDGSSAYEALSAGDLMGKTTNVGDPAHYLSNARMVSDAAVIPHGRPFALQKVQHNPGDAFDRTCLYFKNSGRAMGYVSHKGLMSSTLAKYAVV